MKKNLLLLFLGAMLTAALLLGCSLLPGGGGDTDGDGDDDQTTQTATKLGVVISENSIISGNSFTLVVTALDSANSMVSSFNGTVILSVSDGTISPTTVTLSSGTATATPTISGISTSTTVTVTAAFSGLTGGSDTIDVSPPSATKLLVEVTEASITSGDTCRISVTAQDDTDATITDFTGTVNLSVDTGTISPSSIDISTNGTASGSFVITGITTDTTATVTGSFTGLTSGTDTVSVTGAPITATQIVLEVTDDPKEVDNGTAVNLQVTATDDYGNTADSFTGTVNLAASGDATLSSNTVDISTGGTATASPDITIQSLLNDTDVTLTASYSGLTGGTDTVTVLFAPQGTGLLNSDLSSGWGGSVVTGTYYLAERETTDPEISVGGDIVINGGVKLVIYPGVTLEMGSNLVSVKGELEVIGTDAKRVTFRSSTSNWGGITIGGDLSGSATASVTGASLSGLSDSAIYCGLDSSNVSGDVSITNSRIQIDGSMREAIRFRYMASGTTNTFENNIIVFPVNNYYAFNGYSSLSGSNMTFNIRYNTIIGKGSGSIAINLADGNSTSIYNIERNLIAGNYTYALSYNSSAPTHNIVNNFMKAATNWDGVLGGGTWDTLTDNLYESSNADNFGGTWNTDAVFTNYNSGDFTLALTSTFPTLSQASNISSMEGCLTSGHANEVGAYGNGGYPPNYNE